MGYRSDTDYLSLLLRSDPIPKKSFSSCCRKNRVNLNNFEGTRAYEAEILEDYLRDMVTQNILCYDPAKAVFYPQGTSLEWGLRLFCLQND